MAPTVSDRTEAELIALIQARVPAAPEWLLVGIGDDAAVIAPARNRVDVVTVDALVDGVHFDRRFTPPEAIGHRSLAVNLSDLASMGAEPRYALLSMALPPDFPLEHLERLAAGFGQLATEHHVALVGGNLTRTPGPLVIDVTVVGTVKPRRALRRLGARPGDAVYVSGTLGAAAAGLRSLQATAARGGEADTRDSAAPDEAADEAACVERYLRPLPRVRLGLLLGRNRAASACMDLSDGLADGVQQIARISGVGITIDPSALPIPPAAAARFRADGLDPVIAAVTGGDDYELLFTVRPRTQSRLRTVSRHADIPITRIGVCTEDRQVLLGDAAMPRGYGHFR